MLYTKIASQLKRKSFLERTLILSEMNFNSDIFDVTMMARDGFYLGNAKTQLRIMDRVLSEAELDLKHHLADGSGEQGTRGAFLVQALYPQIRTPKRRDFVAQVMKVS